jgi:hypothetical protein
MLMTFALTGAVTAQGRPGGASFCRQYAEIMSGIAKEAIQKNPACLDYSKGVHDVVKMHYDWCMRTPRRSVEGAEDNIRRLVSACTGNARGPRPRPAGNAQPPNFNIDLNLRWSGSWVWAKTGQSNNISTFEMRKNNTASYCYDRDCRTVPYQFNNGVLSFSRTGQDYFELRPMNNGDVVIGRYWFDRKHRNAAPVATARFKRAGP